jgi:hypothetical protein
MAALLFFEPLAQGLKQLVEATERFDLRLLFLGEIFLGELLEPFDRDLGGERGGTFEALEYVSEYAIEFVEVALVLHQRRSRQIVEVLDAPRSEVLLHRFHQGEVFAQRHRNAGLSELVEEGDEHAFSIGATPSRVKLA